MKLCRVIHPSTLTRHQTMTLLFQPFRLRETELPNRLVLSPMCQYAAVDGCATDWHVMHLGRYACANIGLVLTEATAVEPRGRISPQCLGLYSDACEEALARVIRFCKDYGGARFGIQLAHAGRKSSVPASFLSRRALSAHEGGWTPLSPSPYEDGIHAPPHVMTEADIDAVIAHWTKATQRAARLGCDLVELHFAHGYLINEFLSPLINRRDDRWGGSRENRMRLALRLFAECRAAFPQDRPMGVRISAVDWVDGGWDLEDSCALGRRLAALGCDYVCTSSGGVSTAQRITAGPGYQVPFARALRQASGLATIAVGQITEPQQAEEILENGDADLIALGRGLLRDPNWAWKAAEYFDQPLDYAVRFRSVQPKRTSSLPEQPEGLFMFR
jgi:2,4-dienoyl-CoA reductase-like NADH-dependent reductase (Old Yellow Enzyme family)